MSNGYPQGPGPGPAGPGWSHLVPEESGQGQAPRPAAPGPYGNLSPQPPAAAAAPPPMAGGPAPADYEGPPPEPAYGIPAAALASMGQTMGQPRPPGPGYAAPDPAAAVPVVPSYSPGRGPMEPQSPNSPSPVQARPPVGSTAGPHSEVLYEGVAKHSVSIPGYAKWVMVSVLGGLAAFGLGKITFFSSWPLWVLGLVGLPGMLVVFLHHVTTRYKITLRRVETERGIITKKVESLELWRVLDVRYSQSIFDRITGNGRVVLESTDKSDPKLELHGLPEHRKVFEQLREAVQAARHTSRPMEIAGTDGAADDMGAFGHHHHH